MSTETTTAEIEEYRDAVRDAMADLPIDVRDELLDDLAEHLAEVSAEGEGTLRDRLGEPAAYALELRAAAGLGAPDEPAELHNVHDRLAIALRRAAAAGARTDVRLGRLVGYARLSQLLRALAPGWWVLRGFIVAQLVCSRRGSDGWSGFFPPVGNSRTLGGAITLALIVVSVLLGRSASRFTDWPRRIAYLASAAIAVWGVAVLAPYIASTHYVLQSVPASSDQYGGIADVYVYDQSGNPVPDARLFDQDGHPVQLGDPDCTDGGRGTSSNAIDPYTGQPTSDSWTYPLCPDVRGPFVPPGPVGTESSSAPTTPATAGVPTTAGVGTTAGVPTTPAGTAPSPSSTP